MIKVAFVTRWTHYLWSRQLPNGQNCFDDVEFFVPPEDADVIFVYDMIEPYSYIELNRQIPKIYMIEESGGHLRDLLSSFWSQFDYVVSYTREAPHPNLILGQTGIFWFAGVMSGMGPECDTSLYTPFSFDDFKTHTPQKTKLVSVVASNQIGRVYRARLDFVARLKDALGDQVDVFGRGINGFVDKRDVLDDYRYHIAIENSVVENYWTEKLADPYLTLTFPIYHGCPNIADYFHHDAIRTINIYEPDKAIETIKHHCLRPCRKKQGRLAGGPTTGSL